jgi:endogenous inhibitor of DNA gyrase (YacG/DUF329 family)
VSVPAQCPACGKPLPWGEKPGRAFSLQDKRELDCPHCGHPLERLRWSSLIPLYVILAVGIAIKNLLGPLLEWKTVLLLLALAALYHFFELRSMWRKRQEQRKRLALGLHVEDLDEDDD